MKTPWIEVVLCSGVSYFLMIPLLSNKCMLLVLIVVVSLNFFTRPSARAIAIFSSESESSKCTFVSVLCSRKSCISPTVHQHHCQIRAYVNSEGYRTPILREFNIDTCNIGDELSAGSEQNLNERLLVLVRRCHHDIKELLVILCPLPYRKLGNFDGCFIDLINCTRDGIRETTILRC